MQISHRLFEDILVSSLIFFLFRHHIDGHISGAGQVIDMDFGKYLACLQEQLSVKFHAHGQCEIISACVFERKF